jgi:hypothetical protein
MGKTIFVLLIMLSVLVAAIAGGNQQIAVLERNLLPSAGISSQVTPSETPEPKFDIPDISPISQFKRDFWIAGTISTRVSIDTSSPPRGSIAGFLFEHGLQPYWLGLAQGQGSGLTLNRTSSSTKLSDAGFHKFIQRYRQSEIQIPSKCSRHLLESSPPGFFLQM